MHETPSQLFEDNQDNTEGLVIVRLSSWEVFLSCVRHDVAYRGLLFVL